MQLVHFCVGCIVGRGVILIHFNCFRKALFLTKTKLDFLCGKYYLKVNPAEKRRVLKWGQLLCCILALGCGALCLDFTEHHLGFCLRRFATS
jgi:hypothetical protein